MKRYSIGIDSGSTFTKTVLLDEQRIVDYAIHPTTWNPNAVAYDMIGTICEKNRVHPGNCYIVSTGYGRNNIEQSNKAITEITCHARGAMFLQPGVHAILDIGGQDSKAIVLASGKVVDFLMNDKCAAGTGRFLSMICDKLEIDFDEVDQNVNMNNPVSINNMCAVFAESEVIGLLANGAPRSDVLGGVVLSIGEKISQLANKVGIAKQSDILFTGGPSSIASLRETIQKLTGYNVATHALSVYAGAIGAALPAAQ